MADNQLKKYVEEARISGINDSEIETNLKSNGWDDATIKELFKNKKGFLKWKKIVSVLLIIFLFAALYYLPNAYRTASKIVSKHNAISTSFNDLTTQGKKQGIDFVFVSSIDKEELQEIIGSPILKSEVREYIFNKFKFKILLPEDAQNGLYWGDITVGSSDDKGKNALVVLGVPIAFNNLASSSVDVFERGLYLVESEKYSAPSSSLASSSLEFRSDAPSGFVEYSANGGKVLKLKKGNLFITLRSAKLSKLELTWEDLETIANSLR